MCRLFTIGELAQQKGLSKAELARRTGLSETTVRRWWTGEELQAIRKDTLEIFCQALGVTSTAEILTTSFSRKRKEHAR